MRSKNSQSSYVLRLLSCLQGHREQVVLHQLLDLSKEWLGYAYDLLAKNCNHFCESICKKRGVQKLPTWVNRFANKLQWKHR